MKTTRIRYIHDRAIRYDRPIGNLRMTDSFQAQRRTVAMRGLEDGSVEVAIAWCPLNKQFNRRIGRDIASGRLLCERPGYNRDKYVIVLNGPEKIPGLVGDSAFGDGTGDEVLHLYGLVVRDIEKLTSNV